MRVVLTGATGFVGRALVGRLKATGHEVVAISRNPAAACERLSIQEAYSWNDIGKAFETPVDGVIHLAGESVQGLWTKAKIKEVWDSRIWTTTKVVDAVRNANARPSVLISASGVGFYGDVGETQVDENAEPGDDYFAKLCVEWEQIVLGADLADVRRACTRFGIILGEGGGALPTMKLPALSGLSGPLGTGRQWWSWVSLEDTVRSVSNILSDPTIEGPVNVVAPESIRQIEFQKILCASLSRPCVLPAPAFAVRLMLGQFADEVLSSKRVVPGVLRESGFVWNDADLRTLLDAIV